ncbi:hypothetical protein Pcinc_005351 [Petrolisthes cinctipes]|uniref:C2H2-type domain-containing protein n=1 Tax=Petrolisthes cinctipes TaxID=88211 RepID=A0AAE1GFA8_PETCI|nr:hypothetical protein Pcinc_005351 [Petrolisthes cinctipes]
MEGEGEGGEEGLGAAAGGWTTATYQAQELNSVVHIIVPDLTCIPHGQPNDALTSALTDVAASGALVGHGNGGTSQVKDPLSALAAAAEMDQVRNDVAAVEHMMEETKYSHLAGEQVMGGEDHPDAASNSMQPAVIASMHMEDKAIVLAPLPLAPFLSPDDPDGMFYNEVYHYLSNGTFPEGASEAYKKGIKKRSTNYMINEDGRLSYGHKVPKDVITSPEDQQRIIESEHVDHATGVHFGVKKMYGSIFSKYYWRTMYVDVGNYCRRCEKCNEITVTGYRDVLPPQPTAAAAPGVNMGQAGEDHMHEDDDSQKVTTLPTDRIIRVWKKVQVKIYGPYNRTVYGNELLLTIVDPFSKWIVAQPSPEAGVEIHCANFIFDAFCQFGFAQSHVVGMSSEMFEQMQACYREKFDRAQETLRNLVPFDSEEAQKSFLFTLQEESRECAWAGEMLDQFCIDNPATWDQELSQFLFQFRTMPFTPGSFSPFNMMFARNPTGYVSEEEKENINLLEEEKALEVPSKRRRLQSSTLQCRHCHETFTSKISFRIHQRKHTEEARKRGTMDGEEPLRPILQEKKSQPRKIITRKRRRPFGRGPERLLTLASSDWSDQQKESVPNDENRQQLTQSTVLAVKALLNATKEERSKRGKYIKYSPELRDEIAQYALTHGNHEATVYWSHRLGGTVSESTIRNFIKTYKSYTPEVKEEIGKFAFQYGIDHACRHFTEKLGHEVRKGLIRKFKKTYLKKCPEMGEMVGDLQVGTGGVKRNVNLPGPSSARQKRSYSLQMKDEIGRYAVQFGITAAIQHYTEKLQFPVKESTVRKFKKQFVDRNNIVGVSTATTSTASETNGVVGSGTVLADPQAAAPQTIDILHPSLSVLNTPAVSGAVNVSTANNFVYQHPYHLNMTPGPQTNTVLPMNHNSIAFHQGGVINQGMATSLSYQQPNGAPTSSVITNQSFTHQGPTGFQQGYVGGFSQGGGGGGAVTPGGQIAPLAMTHTSVAATTIAHSPLPLTMSGAPATHISQLSHHTATPQISQAHLAQTSGVPHTVVGGSQHPAHHQLITSFHQPLSGSLSFEGNTLQAHAQANLSNEPLSLMKETHDQPTGVALGGQGEDSIHGGRGGNGTQPSMAHMAEQPGTSDQQESILGIEYEDEYNEAPPSPRKKKETRIHHVKPRARILGLSKRGNYASYSPELRAEIGKYAAEHGNLAAVQHFKEQLGFEIPESTVRGLKDKYLIKRVRGKKEVVTIGFAQRGRPMRLGKYDEIVQDCIRQLVKDGEKVSSFLAIATAKQVLMQYEPSLLEEYGGPVRLNPTWAKSFLKRIGLHQMA